MNPQLIIDLEKLETNIKFLTAKLRKQNLSIMAVTKVHSATPAIVALFEKFPEIEYFGDSRVANLMTYQASTKQKVLIRIPMHSEVRDVVCYADISFNSEISTIRLLNEQARSLNKVHQVVLMVDLGDLREGYFAEADLMLAATEVMKLDHIKLVGLGVNLTCYGAILPDEENLGRLVAYSQKLEEKLAIKLPIISGGNSSSLYLLENPATHLPAEITNLRIGEAFFTGGETAHGRQFPEMHADVVVLAAQIVELKTKPSLPIGKQGIDAFGKKPTFEDKGQRLRGILAIGRQDIDYLALAPLDAGLEIVGASSDHLIVDFTQSKQTYAVGDVIKFKLGYGAMLAAFTSKYVTKEYKKIKNYGRSEK